MTDQDPVEQVQVLQVIGNSVVVKLPLRRFPSVTMQGDTLHGLLTQIRSVLHSLDKQSEPRSALQLIADDLEHLLTEYETTLKANNYELPYRKD